HFGRTPSVAHRLLTFIGGVNETSGRGAPFGAIRSPISGAGSRGTWIGGSMTRVAAGWRSLAASPRSVNLPAGRCQNRETMASDKGDSGVIGHIQDLVQEEQRLYQQGTLGDSEQLRLQAIKV